MRRTCTLDIKELQLLSLSHSEVKWLSRLLLYLITIPVYTLRDYSKCVLSIGNWRILQLLCKILYLNLKGADFFEYRYGDSPVTSQKSSTHTFLQQNPEIFLNSPHQLSSLPLQIFLFLNIWYAMVFCVAELLLYVYKGTFTEVLTRVAGLLFLTL